MAYSSEKSSTRLTNIHTRRATFPAESEVKMAKFKKGDKVRILDGSRISNYTGGWTPRMNYFIDKITTIDTLAEFYNGRIGYRMKEEEFKFIYDERSLELVNRETIVIYRKDNKVIALDKSTGKKATARCNPADTFDFMTGAKLAFDRLTDEKKRFKVGDIVRGKYGSSDYYSITNERMTKGEVVAVSNNGEFIKVKIIDHINKHMIGYAFPGLNPKHFELIEEAKPQE